jgi:NADH-quinone oxidoreductase subunit E
LNSPHEIPRSASSAPDSAGTPKKRLDDTTRGELREIAGRYPEARSALLPMLHLVQSVEGCVTIEGIETCADILGLSAAEVSGVATFYTMYKRRPMGEHHVGVCTNTLCAVMGGDAIFEELQEHLGVGNGETTDDGKVTLEHIECNAACDFAPVVMVNWEFFDNQTPRTARQLVDDIRLGKGVTPTRGANTVCTFKQMSRVLAGFDDGRADEGVGAAGATLVGLELAHQRGWAVDGLYDGDDGGRRSSRAPVEQIAEEHVSNPDAPSAHGAAQPGQPGRARPAGKRGSARKDS